VSNPSRAKGTKWEVELLDHLRELFGEQVERAPLKGVHDYGDFLGVPWLHEAKSTIKPLFQAWARVSERKADDFWTVLWHGDRRSPGSGPYVLMPINLYRVLVSYALDNWEYGRPRIDLIKDDMKNPGGWK
jgi:hypothetical protein